jgi:hypothetical protein
METGNRKILVYRPVTVWMAAVAAVLSMLAIGWLLFEQGAEYAGQEIRALYQERSRLRQRLDQLRRERGEMNEQFAILRRSSEIDQQASLDIRDEFARQQDELFTLRKELEFYQGILSPGDVRAGVRIQDFQVERSGDPGRFIYSLTLVQVKQNENYVNGKAEIDIEGMQDDDLKMMALADLATDGKKAINFRFRYFQHFNGELALPAEFRPERLRVRVKPRGKGQPETIEQFIDWPYRESGNG